MESVGQLLHARLRLGERLRRHFGWVGAGVERGELRLRVRRAREQLLVVGAAEATLRVGDAFELGLDLLETPGLGAERVQERAQLGRGLAQAKLDIAQLVAGARELGSERLERRDGALGEPGQARGSLAVLRRERLDCSCRPGDELLEMAEPLALLAQLRLRSRLEPVRVLDESA